MLKKKKNMKILREIFGDLGERSKKLARAVT